MACSIYIDGLTSVCGVETPVGYWWGDSGWMLRENTRPGPTADKSQTPGMLHD